MSTNVQTAAAIAALDAPHRDPTVKDWELTPLRHREALPPEAGALRRVLERPEVTGIATEFEHADRDAIARQNSYRKSGRIVIWARLLALGVGAFALLPLAKWPPSVKIGLIALQAGALAVSYVAALLMARRSHFVSWMEARGKAEVARLRYFTSVTSANESVQPSELPLLPLQLEYFRRYQLDVQRSYFQNRGRAHEAAARRQRRWRWANLAIVVGLAGTIVWLLGILDGSRSPGEDEVSRILIAFMTMISAIQAAFGEVSQMELNERNAARYAATLATLEALEQHELPAARAAAAAADAHRVAAFCDAVSQEIAAEHRTWAALRQAATRPEDAARAMAAALAARKTAGAGPRSSPEK